MSGAGAASLATLGTGLPLNQSKDFANTSQLFGNFAIGQKSLLGGLLDGGSVPTHVPLAISGAILLIPGLHQLSKAVLLPKKKKRVVFATQRMPSQQVEIVQFWWPRGEEV